MPLMISFLFLYINYDYELPLSLAVIRFGGQLDTKHIGACAYPCA